MFVPYFALRTYLPLFTNAILLFSRILFLSHINRNIVYENITFDISALCSVIRGANELRLQKLVYPTIVLYNPDDKLSPLIRRLSHGLFHVVCPGLCERPGAS